MGSEKKRKRVSTEPDATDADKAERKRLKKLRKEKEAAAAAAAAVTASSDDEDTKMTETPTPKKSKSASPEPLLSPIASPMASRKLTKKLFKVVEAAAKDKALRRGIKEVILALRKMEKGVVILAGDVFPVDVIAHIPLVCEEAGVPYCFVPSKLELGHAGMTKRPTSVVLISDKRAKSSELQEKLKEMAGEVKAIQNLY